MGHKSYSQVTAIRCDGVNLELMGMSCVTAGAEIGMEQERCVIGWNSWSFSQQLSCTNSSSASFLFEPMRRLAHNLLRAALETAFFSICNFVEMGHVNLQQSFIDLAL